MTIRTAIWLKDNFQNMDPQDYHVDMVDTFGLARLGITGRPWYVDPINGSNTANNGEGPDTPFASTQTGIDASTADAGDVVVRMRGGEEVTETVNFNKGGVSVIGSFYGLNPLAQGEYFSIFAAAAFTDGPVATVTARCTIAGIGFVSRDVGALFFSGAAMLIGGLATAAPFGVHVLNCRFPKWGLDNRIGIAVEGSSDVLIEECGFEGVGSAFDSGIYVQGATQNIEIRNNRFRDCTYAITHGAFAGGGPHCVYKSNVCEDSKMLDSGVNAATGLITDNFLETATDGASYDDTVATLQGQGLNFSGNHYSE